MRLLRYGTALLLAATWMTPLQAQQTTGTIRGRVTDESSQLPLRGALVRYGGRHAQAREDGGYLLTDVSPGSDSLRVTMIGYAPVARSVTVSAGETVDVEVALAPQAVNLAELVVVGYGEQRQGNVTGALTNVTSEEFNTGRVVTPTELIQNKVAGVQVVENTEPGGRTSIRIRGGTSTSASNEPLYVIDGQPLGTDAGGGVTSGRDPLNFLNPEDIASITVLRDAGAAAIYGTNAANGVVLITTKRGEAGERMKLEYTGSVSASTTTRTPTMLNAEQFRTAVEQFAPGSLSQLQNENTDWYGAIDRTGFGQEHNVALSGGGAKNDYRVSFNFLDQRGIVDANSARRYGLGLNFNQRLADDRLNLRLSVRGSRTDDRFTPLGVLSNAAQYGPTQPITDDANPTGFYEWPGNTATSADNPVAILNLAEEKAETYRAIGTLQAEYRLPWVDGLRANVTLGLDASDGKRRNFLPSVLHEEQARVGDPQPGVTMHTSPGVGHRVRRRSPHAGAAHQMRRRHRDGSGPEEPGLDARVEGVALPGLDQRGVRLRCVHTQGSRGEEDPGGRAGRLHQRPHDVLREAVVDHRLAGPVDRDPVLRHGPVAGEHQNHLQAGEGPHQRAVRRAEARQVLRRGKWKVHARLEHVALALGAVDEEALGVADVVGERLEVLGHEDVCRVAGESLAHPPRQPRERAGQQ
jgi:TonB-dependent SusC/RagA subfamily outer membrane receptor